MATNRRKKPWLPDGTGMYIGLALGLVVGLWMLFSSMPFYVYIPSALLIFVACLVGIQWSEDDRTYWGAVKIAEEVQINLSAIREIASSPLLKRRPAIKWVLKGIENCQAILEELQTKKSYQYYGGISSLKLLVSKMLTIAEYADILQFPGKAGDKLTELVQGAEQGFQGFCEDSGRMLESVNQGDILSLSVNSRMLGSLRRLLGLNQNEEEQK